MEPFTSSLSLALGLALHHDPDLVSIVSLSLRVSALAAVCAALIGFPLGALVAVGQFRGRAGVTILLNALVGLPAVVVGLAVYLLLSRAGPLGSLGLLFTPGAMVIAQAILVAPLVAALTRQTIADSWDEYRDQLRSLGATRLRATLTLLWDNRFSLASVFMAAFGRAVAEVGSVMIVGGNIAGVTRVMTTAIALETSKGDLPLALALGAILLVIVIMVNALSHSVASVARQLHG